MIGFGELRKISAQWGVLPDVAERVYALDWLIKGIFDRVELARVLVLRDATALGKAYFDDYPLSEGIDCGLVPHPLPRFTGEGSKGWEELRGEFESAAREVSTASGLKFALVSFETSEAKFDFVGPLGRRSAAQPHLSVRMIPITLRRAANERKLIYPFSDACEAKVRAVALEELAAERLARLRRSPRARDVFDLWFIVTHGVERAATLALAEESAREKNSALPDSSALFDDSYRALLARGWDKALKNIRARPTFEQVEAEVKEWVGG